MQFQSLGWDEKMETHSVFLPENPMNRGARAATVHMVAKITQPTEQLSTICIIVFIGCSNACQPFTDNS